MVGVKMMIGRHHLHITEDSLISVVVTNVNILNSYRS